MMWLPAGPTVTVVGEVVEGNFNFILCGFRSLSADPTDSHVEETGRNPITGLEMLHAIDCNGQHVDSLGLLGVI